MLWGLTAADLATILLTIGSLVLLEGLLSGDNALVLAIMVRPLPPLEQRRALRYGIWGAFVFRFIAVILGSYLIRFWWLKVVGGLYLLIWIAGRHFLVGDHENSGRGRSTFGTGFWATVISVEITDIVFSIDSILAAVATSRGLPTHLQQYPGLVVGVIWVGGVLGILMMRVAAGFFIALMEKFVGLAHGAYALVAWIGLKLFGGGMHDAFREIPAGDWRLRIPIEARNFPWEMNAVLFWGGMVLIVVLSMAAPRPRRREVKDGGSETPVEGLDARANGAIRSKQPGRRGPGEFSKRSILDGRRWRGSSRSDTLKSRRPRPDRRGTPAPSGWMPAMAAIDPYAPCPCGSGQKFKWCCQGVEPVADRAQRLFEGNQIEAAFQALDEGLKKTPDNPWLLTRKALYELRRGRFEAAKPLLEKVIAKQPGHIGAGGLLLRVILETEGPVAGVKTLQRMLAAVPIESLPNLAVLAQIVGMALGETGHAPAAIEHLTLALELMPGDDEMAESSLRSVLSNPATSPWLRNIYELSPAPDGLAPPLVERFEKAIDRARRGQWTEAASGFESLSSDRVPLADRNLGLCRLWLADNGPAAQALRRFIASSGEAEEAVDLEALCQLVAPPKEEDLVEQVQLTWTLRNRDALLAALRADASIDDEGPSPADPDDPEAPEVDSFALLDRPRPAGDTLPATADQVPKIVGRALVGKDVLALETFDDGRLDKLTKRLVAVAGSSIPPAHPKTKVLGSVPRPSLAMQAEWWTPENVDRKALAALYAAERVRLVREVWTSTPMPYLKGRTPLQAAKSGDAKVPLRAAVCMLELAHEFHREGIDFAALRADLNIPAEPEIDPETVEISEVHLARLHRIPAERLDDDKLIQLFDRAHGNVLPLALERSAKALSERPSALRREGLGVYIVFADLANLALSRGAIADAFDIARRGRAADPNASRDAVRWDMMEIRLRARSEAPEEWVPQLAVLLERYSEDRQSSSAILSNLMDMGLVQMVPNPDRPEEMLLDTRPLQAVLSRFGPKITTASGRLGVSATSGGIWTPGSQAGGSTGGLWTPGSGPPPATSGDKPKLIIPGR